MNNIKLNVLWIEDKESLHIPYCMEAESAPYFLNLVPFTCWEDAEKELNGSSFDKWSAIILDAKCKYKKTDSDKAERFLPQVFTNLLSLYKEHNRTIPWYVLSGGGAEVGPIEDLIVDERLKWDSDWPKKYYSKNTERLSLFTRIKEHASLSNRFQLKTIYYRELFESISDLSLNPEVEDIMTKLLLPVHFQEENSGDYNDLYPRCNKVLEHIFRSMIKNGILPPSLGNKSGKGDLNLSWASKFLSGRLPDLRKGDNPSKSRFEIRKTVFPVVVADFVKFISFASGSEKHTGSRSEKDVYDMSSFLKSTKGSPFLLRSIAYQLADLILWYKDYIDNNPDKSENECYWGEKQ